MNRAYWDDEAARDPRYAAARWGMNGFTDADETIEEILTILETGLRHDVDRKHEVLEIGAGPGRLLSRLAERHPEITFCGLDISPKMMERYLERRRHHASTNTAYFIAHTNNPVAEAQRFRGRRRWNGLRYLPDGLCEFSLVYAVELFQHLLDGDVQAYIDAAYEALMPGGMLLAQFVARGEPGPASFPRSIEQIGPMYHGGWHRLEVSLGVHPDWLWITARK